MYKHIKTFIVASSIALVISGCSTMTTVKKDQEIERLTQELSVAKQKADQLDGANGRIKELESKEAMVSATAASQTNTVEEKDTNAVSNSLIPPNAKTGECYARVLVPEVYEETSVERLEEEAKTEIEIIPATYKVVEEKVTIREASVKLVAVPETYKTETETVMVEPEKTQLQCIPATYATETEQVMVSAEKTEIKTIPATYKTTKQEVMISEEKTELIAIPTTYKIVEEKVLVADAYTTWKRGKGAIEKIDDSTGEIMCLVEVPEKYKTLQTKVVDVAAHTKKVVTPAVYKTILTRDVDTLATTKEVVIPAVYKTVIKQVIATPATTKEIIIPAVYKTVSRQVTDTPATTREVEIPCISKMVKRRVVDTPAQEIVQDIPAVYGSYTKVTKISDSYLRWQEILCETNVNSSVISKVQKALQEKGYKITMIDGVFGKETNKAIKAYQKDNQLSQGALTLKTLESLGL